MVGRDDIDIEGVSDFLDIIKPFSVSTGSELINSDPNGTYLTFLGWPYFLTFSRAIVLGFVSNG
jgi:hypothetical protein